MDNFEKGLMGMLVFLILLSGLLVYIQAGKEAEFYTRLTGIEVTRTDAFWLDLDPSKHVIQVENQ